MRKDRGIGAIVLAGGHGQIRTGTSKLLEPILPDGTSMIGQVARNAFDSWGRPLAFVTSQAYGEAIYGQLAEDAGPFLVEATPVTQGRGRGAAEALYEAAHRVRCGCALVMFGDMPLWRPATLMRLMDSHHETGARVTMATVSLDLPGASPRLARYGRVIRDGHGLVSKVVEPADATQEELAERTVNPSLYVFDLSWFRVRCLLLPFSDRGDGRAPEKEIPKVVEMAYREGEPVVTVPIDDPTEALGVNSSEELEEVRRILSPEDGISRELGLERTVPFERRSRASRGR